MEEERIVPSSDTDDEISLLDLLAVLWHRKWLILGITVAAMIAVVAVSVISLVQPPESSILPNKYTPQALMLINDSSSSGSSLSSVLNSSGLGSLASLAGVSVPTGSSNSALAVYLCSTNSFLDAVVDKFDLINRYEIEKNPRANSRKALKEVLTASVDEDTGVLSVSFTDIDPVFARDVVDFCVDYLEQRFLELGLDQNLIEKKNLEENIETAYNEILRLQKESQQLDQSVAYGYGSSAASIPSIILDASMLELELQAQQTIYTQLKARLELLKVSMASEKPVFQVLERPEVPDMKSGPSRGMLCIIVTFAAGFFSVFLAFFLNALDNIKKDPEAIKKFKK